MAGLYAMWTGIADMKTGIERGKALLILLGEIKRC